MTMKILTDKRGALQGMSVADIVRQVYGPTASYVRTEGEPGGLIVRSSPSSDTGPGEVIDTVIDVHEAA